MRVCWPTLVILAAGCGKPAAPTSATVPAEAPPVSVTAAPVAARTLERRLPVVGSLMGYDEVSVSAKVDGRVLAVRADVGDRVVPGAVLFELDPTDLRLEVEAARRGVESELAKLNLAAMPGDDFEVDAVPSVRRAADSLASMRVELTRTRRLAAGASVTAKELDTAELDAKTAESSYRDAQTQARATLASAKLKLANLASAEQKLADAVVRAPVPSGYEAWAAAVGPGFTPLKYAVAQRLIAEGEVVRSMPVTVAFKLVIDYSLKLRASVPESLSAAVRVDQPAEVRVDAYPAVAFAGRVSRINPTVEASTRAFQLELTVPNLDGRLKAGGFARAGILLAADAGVLTVPATALVSLAGVNKVFVLDGGTAKAVEVAVGVREKDWLEVRAAGLRAGMSVATSGFSQLVDGSRVAVR